MALIEVIGAIKWEPSIIKSEPSAVVEICPDDIFQPSDEEDAKVDKKQYISETKIVVGEDVEDAAGGHGHNNFSATENLREDERLVLNFNKQVTNDDSHKESGVSEQVDWANIYRTHEETSCLEEQRKVRKVYGPSWNKPIQQEEFTFMSKKSFICNYCHQEFKGKKNVVLHIRKLHRESSVTLYCPYCPKQSKWSLRYHILAEHKNDNEINWFQCYQCNKKFRRKELLVKHIETHLGKINEGSHPCPTCERIFNNRRSMLDHVRKIHVRKHQCDKCSFSGRNLNRLKEHIEVCHTDPFELPIYQCSKCNFKTRHRRYYKSHCKKHERRYICDKCVFTASTYTALKLHEHVHKEKLDDVALRYRCKKCDYKTYRHYSMQVHELTHLKPEETNYFYCYHCNFKARRKDNLKTHVLRHFKKEDVTFHCFMCDFETKKRDALTEHLNRHQKSPETKNNSALEELHKD